jgi:hypothetical protein
MKSSLAAALIVLQIATAGLVVTLLLKRNEPAALDPAVAAEIHDLVAKVQGAVNQSRIIVDHLEELRKRAAGRGDAAGGPGDPPAPTPPAEGSAKKDPSGSPAASPFPEATAALQRAKELERDLRREIKDNKQNVEPLRAELARAKKGLVDRGNEAVYVVGGEVDLQPFEKTRDAQFTTWLLDEVVPAFGAEAKSDAFRIARSALVRATNEASVKFAAARALQRIDDRAWVKEVIDVITLGSADEVDLRAQLLGLFADAPRPEAVDLCKHFMEDARYPAQLRTKAVMVIEKQDSGAVNPALRRLLFEDTSPLLKIHALDALLARLKDPADQKKLLEDVVAIDPARLPDAVLQKAQRRLAELNEPNPAKPK